MLEFIQSQILFYFAIILVLFAPGYFMLLAFFGNEKLNALERFILATGLSIIVTDFLMLAMSRVGLFFTRTSLFLVLLIFNILCFLIYQKRFAKIPKETRSVSFDFSLKQFLLISLILFLSVFLRTAYLQNTIPPSSTDLGHHIYWAKLFAESGKIQNYIQSDIVEKNKIFQIDASHPISDFIIGEHLIFSAIGLISGANFVSAFPILILLLINIATLLALFILALRLFEDNAHNKNIAIFALLFTGVLFAIDPPQAKFVGGGVIGNIIGNLLVPLTFYFYLRFLKEKEITFLFFALFFSMGLFYTHHLTALIFLLTFIGFIAFSLLFNFRETRNIILIERRVFRSPLLISFFLFALLFIFIVYTPTYLENSAVKTVVGTIKKIDHTGLSLLQFRDITGEARVALGFLGTLLLLFFYRKNISKYSSLLLISWVIVITLISLAPNLVKLDIPSSRVANYGAYPFALLGAFAFISIFRQVAKQKTQLSTFSQKLILIAYSSVFVFIFMSGFAGDANYLKSNGSGEKAEQTFQASRYLASKIDKKDILISDHIYLFADSWIKLFFMRGYDFPLYRANLDRYENGVDKNEFCSRDMISNPGGELSRQCFSDLGVDFAIVNKKTDSAQFRRLENFWQVFSNDEVNIYYRKKYYVQ